MRKKCIVCKKPLIAFQGHYLHPDVPCSGVSDSMSVVATVDDDFLYKKFIEQHGKPIFDDYELLNKIYRNPILRFLILLFIRKKKK